jgi:2-polyprenyl-3-methyl-5-hydroxy-6-metoxy-1,4-benzoquinol methylase
MTAMSGVSLPTMDPRTAYNSWAGQYDFNETKTRDLEALSLRQMLEDVNFDACLEIGCGTGKNTGWLAEKAKEVTAIDLSEEMLARAREKVESEKVRFKLFDITGVWNFDQKEYDLVTFSLVLEHIKDLEHVFEQASKKLADGGHLYVGELHPFKQYTGSKARFETESGVQVVTCYNHHISEFIHNARKFDLKLLDLREFFDTPDTGIPRILSLIFKK